MRPQEIISPGTGAADPRRSLRHVDEFPVLSLKIKGGGGNAFSDQEILPFSIYAIGQGLEENLRQDHRRAQVKISPALHPGDQIGKTIKIPEAAFPQGFPVAIRVKVGDIRSDRHVDGNRDPLLVSRR